jgi:hypothetical protein
MLRHFGKKEKIAHPACDDICRACMLLPDAVSDWSSVLALADRAAKMCPEEGRYMTTRGAVLYRAGRWAEALGPLTDGHRSVQKVLEINPNAFLRYDDARGCAYLAMAHHRLGHREEARKWFDTMEQQMATLTEERRTGKVYFMWNILVTMNLLRPEAARLLEIIEKPLP